MSAAKAKKTTEAEQAAKPGAEQVKQVGDKAFIQHDGVWVDTTFDEGKMKAQKITFGSEGYFKLLADHPEIGRYLALGDRVTVVVSGKAYAIAP